MAENINDLKQKLGEEKPSEKKEAKAAPDKENKGNGLGAKAVNIGKGAASKAGGAAQSAISEGANQADDEAGETASQMSQDLQGMKDMKNTLSQLNDRRKEFGAAKANNQAAEYMKGLDGANNIGKMGDVGKGVSAGAKKGAGKGATAGAKAGAKGIGKILASVGKFLVSNPVGWAILGILLVLILLLVLIVIVHGTDQENKRAGNYEENPLSNGGYVETIEQTVNGLFYQKYSDMSIYAGVDMSKIEEGNEEAGCPGEATNYTDACSGKNFKELTGVDIETIDQDKLYQEGTHEWLDLKIQDINGNEKYIGLSAGALSQLDEKLHIGFKYPEQFIRPVAANCTLNMSQFLADVENNDLDEDGKITLKDCRLRKYDNEGNPEEITEDIYGNPIGNDNRYWMDKTLYLSIARSKPFVSEDGEKAAQDTESYADVKEQPEEYDTTYALWDYGLGTLAHYVAYFQPSRVAAYAIEELDVVCTADGKAAKDVDFEPCAGKKFGEVVTLTREETKQYEDILKDVIYAGDTCNEGANAENPEGCGGTLYIPYNELYFKDWVGGYEKYAENQENLSEDQETYIYTDGLKTGEYPTVGIEENELETYFNEPAISTGVPNTEVKYAIDHAVTFAGTIKFNVKQQWVTQSLAEHTQFLKYTISKNLDVPADSTVKNSGTTEHEVQGNTSDYNYDVCYYYDNEMGICGFSEDDHMVWVAAKEEVEEDGSEEKKQCNWIPNPALVGGGSWQPCDIPYYKHTYTPGHYELNGRIFYKGKEVQLSDIQESYRDDSSSEHYSKRREHSDDDKSKYSWGEIQEVVVAAHKEGYLQTFAVYDSNTVPDTDEIVGLDYFNDYIEDYHTIVPDFISDGWACYNPDKTASKKEWLNESGNVTNYEYASTFKKGEVENGVMDPVTGVTSVTPGDSLFCYAKDSENATGAAPSLYFGSRPLLQIASFAGKLKFSANEDGELLSDVAFTLNKIVEKTGTSTDTRYRVLGTKYPKEFFNYAGMYGIDPTLAALIAAENGEESGNLMGVTSGDYKAYNLGTRSPSTEHYGGSHDSEVTNDFWQTVKDFFSKLPIFRGKAKTHERETVMEQSKEHLTVTVNGGEITAIDAEDGEELEELTQEELSIKIGSMKLQRLQEIYQFNMPMVITAYKYGTDYVDAVLDVYERTVGVSRAAAIASTLDTAWADFRGAFAPAENATEAERHTAELLCDAYEIDESVAIEASDYVERVLSRLVGSGIYYQKVDQEYLELTDEEKEQIEEIKAVDSNTAQHSVGIWLYGTLVDTLAENNMTNSGANRGNLIRSWGILTKETGTIEEDDWFEITGGQIRYPESTWKEDTELGGGDSETLYPYEKYFHYHPDVSDETKEGLVSNLLSFGDDSYYGEVNYDDVEFWRHHYSSMLGSGNKNWKSTMSAIDLFGERPDREEFDPETIDRYVFVSKMPATITPYGYNNNSSGEREYSSRTVYQIQENEDGSSDLHVLAPFDGKVVDVGENIEGKYVVMSIDNYKDLEITVGIEMLDSVNVKEGDVINDVTILGDVNAETRLFSVYMSYDGDLIDFNEAYYSFPSSYNYESWIPITDGMPGGWAGTGGGGGSGGGGNPFPGTGVVIPGDLGDLDGFLNALPKWWAKNGWQEWNTVTVQNSPGNPYAQGQCTALAWEIMSRLYPGRDWSFPNEGNGDQWAASACKYNGFKCPGDTSVGTIISSSPNHVVVITEVHDDGSFCVASGNVSSHLRAAIICYDTLEQMANISKRSWYTLASPQ